MPELPMSKPPRFIVEERLTATPDVVNYAWLLDTQEEAEDELLKQVRVFGPDRLFTAFIHIDD